MKKIVLNFLILILTFFLPLYFQHLHQENLGNFRLTQDVVMFVVFIGAGLLTYINYKFRKQALGKKWIWLIFEIVGIIGLIYSAGILWLLYEFRNGIGF